MTYVIGSDLKGMMAAGGPCGAGGTQDSVFRSLVSNAFDKFGGQHHDDDVSVRCQAVEAAAAAASSTSSVNH